MKPTTKIRRLVEFYEAGKLSEADYYMWLTVYLREGGEK